MNLVGQRGQKLQALGLGEAAMQSTPLSHALFTSLAALQAALPGYSDGWLEATHAGFEASPGSLEAVPALSNAWRIL